MACVLVVADDVGNPLEACVAVEHLDMVGICNAFDGLCGDDGLHAIFITLDPAQFLVTGDDVVEQGHYYLVAVEKLIVAVLVAYHHAHAVGIRVRGAYNLGSCLLCLGYSHSHCLGVLGVGRNHCGEVARLHVLLGYVDDVLEAPECQRVIDKHRSRAVDGGIDNLHVGMATDGIGTEREGVHVGEELLVYVFADYLDKILVALELYLAHIGDGVDVFDGLHIVGGDHLCAVAPVSLVAIVFLGVV